MVENLADYIKEKQQNLKGYSKQNLWRMKQFYETYQDHEKLSTVLREITWSNNLAILSSCKTIEEKEFYIRLSIKEKLSFRELERHIATSSFERVMMSDKSANEALQLIVKKGDKMDISLKDTYVFNFLDDLPTNYHEGDLQKALILKLKDFLLELGRDFCFVGQNYKLQVGNSDFYVDLLLYHRELSCLVCIELKTESFHPQQLGQLNFYLEALDRDVKKPHENPAIGILLCKDKDNAVVEYSLNSSKNSPAMIANYDTKLIPKELLQNKVQELFDAMDA